MILRIKTACLIVIDINDIQRASRVIQRVDTFTVVAKWESFRDEIRVWRLGENLNVKYSFAARLVSGLSGQARMTCMTMDADQLHPPSGNGPVATADDRRNIAGLDNVMSVLQMSPLVKKLPARKNELLHAIFRDDDSLARTKGEPIGHAARAIQ